MGLGILRWGFRPAEAAGLRVEIPERKGAREVKLTLSSSFLSRYLMMKLLGEEKQEVDEKQSRIDLEEKGRQPVTPLVWSGGEGRRRSGCWSVPQRLPGRSRESLWGRVLLCSVLLGRGPPGVLCSLCLRALSDRNSTDSCRGVTPAPLLPVPSLLGCLAAECFGTLIPPSEI